MAPADPLLIDELWRSEPRLGAIARALVGGDAAADDVLQETALTAWKQSVDSGEVRQPAAWLRSVVRNQSKRWFRDRSRRATREARAARPERIDPDDALERAETRERLLSAIEALPEIYRRTVQRRFFGGLEISEIAVLDKVAEKTVYTRLQRALERLRSSLDEQAGGRDVWVAAFAPLFIDPTGSTVTATVATGSATGGAALIGGTVVASKVSFITATAVVAAVVGWGTHKFTAPDQGAEPADEAAVAEWESERDEIAKKLAMAKSAKAALESENERLRAQLEDSQQLLAELNSEDNEPEGLASGVSSDDQVAVAFGKFADLEGVKNADWDEMANATLTIQSLLSEVLDAQALGEQPSPELMKTIGEENMKLIKYAAAIMGDIPTEAPVNGEYTHPITVANIMNATLDMEGLSLSDTQKAQFEQIGASYDDTYAAYHEEYDESTPALTKFIDELALKHDTKLAFESSLSASQRQAILADELRNRSTDLLSPMSMTQMSIRPQRFESLDELRQGLPERFANQYGLDEAQVSQLSTEFDRWIQDLGTLTQPRSTREADHLSTEESILNGRAHARAVEAALQHLSLDDATRSKLLDDSGWLLPQVVEPGDN